MPAKISLECHVIELNNTESPTWWLKASDGMFQSGQVFHFDDYGRGYFTFVCTFAFKLK